MDANLEAKLREMLDKQEIHDLLMRYCRGVDRGDADLIRSVYHPGAIDDHGDMILNAAEIPELFVKLSARSPFGGMHFIGNVLIEVDGDTAYAESYFMAIKDIARETKRFIRIRAGRYVDRLERRQGVWGIVERVLLDEWNRVDETNESLGGPERYLFGQRGAADAVFRIKKERVAREPQDAGALKLRPL
jgi:hypothetical protein